MTRSDLDTILTAMLESHPGISDLIFCSDRPLQVESFGQLKEVEMHPDIRKLSPYQIEHAAIAIMGEDRRLMKQLLMSGSCDCSYSINEKSRFRVNIFRQRGNPAIVMRKAQTEIPSISSLSLPPVFHEIIKEKNGLVLVTGATGSGKTTTLCAMLNEINERLPVHVVTLEDPIEFVHMHKAATFSQRELGEDFETYPSGLRAALRQAPKVILLGEMRDRETVEVALNAAETGHLVFSTLHTIDAGQSINRILGMFSEREQNQVRLRLADTVRYVVSQRLAPKKGGGRLLLLEIMGSNLRIREAVALGEDETRNFYEIIEANGTYGWQTFDQSIARAYQAGLLSDETANFYASRKGIVSRAIDDFKKSQGEEQVTIGLRLDHA